MEDRKAVAHKSARVGLSISTSRASGYSKNQIQKETATSSVHVLCLCSLLLFLGEYKELSK